MLFLCWNNHSLRVNIHPCSDPPPTLTKINHQSVLNLRDRNELIAANNLTTEKKIKDFTELNSFNAFDIYIYLSVKTCMTLKEIPHVYHCN